MAVFWISNHILLLSINTSAFMPMNILRPNAVALVFAVLVYSSTQALAQLKIFEPKIPRDTSYVYNYYGNITTRAYLINKFSNFAIRHSDHNVRYATNTPFGVGIGAIYKIYNANLTVSVPLPSVYEKVRGKSRAIDLQSSMYGQRWVFDLYFNLYKGYYTPSAVNGEYILRPNLHNNTIGINAHYLFNNKGFSYRAFRVNDEWQHRSSGSFFLSMAAFFSDLHDRDRAGFVPIEFNNQEPVINNVYRKQSFAIGPGIGYAYNYVFRRNWFVLASFNGRLMFNYGVERALDGDLARPFSVRTGSTILGAIGYQNERWGLNFSAINTINNYATDLLKSDYHTQTGYIKLNFLYRIQHNNFTRKLIKPFDYLLRK